MAPPLAKPRYTLILKCPDRKGVVAAVSGFLADNDASIVESNHLSSRALSNTVKAPGELSDPSENAVGATCASAVTSMVDTQ